MANLRFLGLLILWAAPVLALAGEVDRTMLEGALWRLASVAHPDGQLHAVPNSVEATATFANGSVSGSGGCNRYTASYTVADGKLTIGRAASTMMACPEPQAGVEMPFMAALAATMAYQIEDGQLSLLNAGGQKIATFKAWQPVALKGVTWRATVYNNGRAAAVSLIDGSEITATFGTDGVLSGSAGCNHYRAAYVAKDSAMTIQTPTGTRKACTQPKGVMQQEQEYLKALTTAATYTLQGNQLELRTDQDALAALFKAK
jgi:heat shock protein HslJ